MSVIFRSCVLATAFTITALASTGLAQTITTEEAETATLSGVVRCEPSKDPELFACQDGTARAHVYVESVSGESHWQTWADRRGRYSLRLPPGRYRVTVDEDIYPLIERAVTVVLPTTTLDFHLGRPYENDRPFASAATAKICFGFFDLLNQPIDGVRVIAENEKGHRWETDESTGAVSKASPISAACFYRLPPGRYRFRIFVPPAYEEGFWSTQDKVLTAGQYEYDGLILGARHSETLTVAAPRSLLKHGSIGLGFSRQALESTPAVNGSTLQSLLSLVPGIVFTDSVGTLAQFTANGQDRFAHRLTIDGMAADLGVDGGLGIGQAGSGALPAVSTLGGTQTLIPFGAVEAIDIRTSTVPPQFARTPGAQTIVVSRSGADRPAATAFVGGRPDALGARDWFSNAGEAPQRRVHAREFAATLGGPLWPHRAQYFAATEYQHIARPILATFAVPSIATREAATTGARQILDAFPLPNGAELGQGLAELTTWRPLASRLSAISLRTDVTLTGRHRMFVRINHGRSSGDELNADREDRPAAPRLAFDHEERTRTNTATARLLSIWSASTNEVRANVSGHEGSLTANPASYGGARQLPIDLLVPAGTRDPWVMLTLFPTGVVMAGRTAGTAQRQIQVADTFAWTHGRQEWRAGFDYIQAIASTDAARDRFTYRFNGVDDLFTGRVRQLGVEHVAPARARRRTIALFAEHSLRPLSRLTLDVGIRASIQPAPTSDNELRPTLIDYAALPTFEIRPGVGRLWQTSRTVAPHLSVSYAASVGTTVSAAWSKPAGEMTNPGMGPYGRSEPYVLRRRLGVSPFPAAVSSLAMPSSESNAGGEYFAFADTLRAPRISQWHVGVDQQLGRGQSLSVAYAGAAGRDLIYWHGYQNGTRLIHAFSNAGRSDYHAFLVRFARRLSARGYALASYAWSHAIDFDSGESRLPLPPPSLVPPAMNRGSADFDRRHVLRATGSYLLPGQWHVDVVATIQSGAPIDVRAARVVNGATYFLRPDLVPGMPIWVPDPTGPTAQRLNIAAFEVPEEVRQGTLGRNAIRAPALRQIDLLLSRTVRFGRGVTVQPRVDVFNLFNTPNFARPAAHLGFPTPFGRPQQLQADALGTGTLTGGGLTPVQQAGGPRSVQIGVKIGF